MSATALPTHTIVAFNTATASDNRIHDDTVAATLGFAGGLVPGVDVAAYLCRPALAHFGPKFCESGRYDVCFERPVYDGDEVTVRSVLEGDTLMATAHTVAGPRAALQASLGPAPTPLPSVEPWPRPDSRPAASARSLQPGRPLGSFTMTCDDAALASYLDLIRDPDSPVRGWGIVHPAWLLRRANDALSLNVVLGPWIHVASHVTHLAPVAAGQPVEVRSRVRQRFERGGHQFVRLDVVMIGAGGVECTHIDHTAIYQPRQVADAADD